MPLEQEVILCCLEYPHKMKLTYLFGHENPQRHKILKLAKMWIDNRWQREDDYVYFCGKKQICLVKIDFGQLSSCKSEITSLLYILLQ